MWIVTVTLLSVRSITILEIPPLGIRAFRYTLIFSSSTTLAPKSLPCLLYTSDAADERSSVDLGGRRIIKKTKREKKKERTITDQERITIEIMQVAMK